MKKRLTGWLVLCLGLAAGPLQADVAAHDPWVREAPPGSNALAGYVVLENRGEAERVLVGADSPEFDRIELHRTEHDGEVMRMRQVEHMAVPPGERLSLETGGRHLMLMGPKRPFSSGDTVPVELHFEDETTLSVTFSVRREGEERGEHHHAY